MAFYVGNNGAIRLRRGTSVEFGSISADIAPDDVMLSLNRVGVEAAVDNLLTGDRVDLITTDARGLAFLPSSNWSTNQIEDTISLYVNVNALGGLRFFTSFEDAVNNLRSAEISLQAFSGADLPLQITVRDVRANTLGSVTSYQFNTQRENIDVTTLTDRFKKQHDAGLLSGSGRIECLFDFETNSGLDESPLFVLQLIHRLDIGCAFDLELYLLDENFNPNLPNIFYRVTAVATGTGVSVESNTLLTCTMDFVTTGEIKLLVGRPAEFLLQENDDRLRLEGQASLGFLLKEITD